MRIPLTRTALLLAGVVFLACTASSPLRAADSTDNEKFISGVFRNIVAAIDAKEAPYLKVMPGKSGKNYFDDLASTIYLDEHLAVMARTFGPDSANVLAFFICHELGHYYRRHAFEGVEITDAELERMRKAAFVKNLLKKEAEAEYFVGFYGRMAGYDPLKKAAQALDFFYKEYDVSYDMDKYPDKGRRKGIALYVDKRLKDLASTFDAANYLGMVREYDRARQCYEHISSIFWSREMLNNAGVYSTLKALQSMDSQTVRYVYPLELDADTRLRGVIRTVRDPSREDSLRIAELLEFASASFKQAMRCDTNYATAKINLATVMILKGKYDEGIRILDGVQHHKSDFTTVLATTARAIALLRKGKTEEGKEQLESVREQAKLQKIEELVTANVNAIDQMVPFKPGKREDPAPMESIDGLDTRDTSTVLPPDYDEEIVDRGKIYSRRKEFGTMTFVVMDTSRIYFIRTEDGYKDASAKGIRIGSSDSDVRFHYGRDPRIINARQGKFYIYDYAKMIFLLDPNTDSVKQWMIYSIY